MSDEKKPASNAKPATPAAPVKTPMQLARDKAKPVGAYTAAWFGIKPQALDPTVEDGQLDQIDIDDTLNTPLTVFGFSERDGDKGKFVVILCAREGADNLFVVVTGAIVIMKKLHSVETARGWPVAGKFVQCAGKQFNYYDFVNA